MHNLIINIKKVCVKLAVANFTHRERLEKFSKRKEKMGQS